MKWFLQWIAGLGFSESFQASSALKTYHLESSEFTLCSVSTLIVGSQAGVLIDPPWFSSEGERLAQWSKSILGDRPLTAIFTTHHHPDHTWSVDSILNVYPYAKYYATPQTHHQFVISTEDKVHFWKKIVGEGHFPDKPSAPEAFNHTFFTLPGDEGHPLVLLSPLTGDTVDHAVIWLPEERVLIPGDLVYGRKYPVYMGDVPTLDLAHAWEKALLLMRSLNPRVTYPGHSDPGEVLDGLTDIDHTLSYVRFFIEHVLERSERPYPKEIYDLLLSAFPAATKNASFLVNTTAETFGRDGIVWEENIHEDLSLRKSENIDAWHLKLPRSRGAPSVYHNEL